MSISKKLLSGKVRKMLEQADIVWSYLQEIRMRIGQVLFLKYAGEEVVLTEYNGISKNPETGYRITAADICDMLESISGYSLYAFEEEMKQGFFTVQGGHRIGIAGKIILADGKVCGIRNISFLNIRINHEIFGCADRILPYITEGGNVCNTLLISPPGAGKTTLLRDMIRQISDGYGVYKGRTVGVVDERSEIAGSWMGIPQNHIGIRTDVMDCCPKVLGMTMLLRSMAPSVIAVDEIGSTEDADAIENASRCGCRIIATAHGNTVSDIKQKHVFRILEESGIFSRYLVIEMDHEKTHYGSIYEETGTLLKRVRL